MQPSKERIKLTPQTNEALKALGWKGWKPEVGDWALWEGAIQLIVDVPFHRGAYDSGGGMRPGQEGDWVDCEAIDGETPILSHKIENLIPLLHWEQIKAILQANGYILTIWLSKGGGKIVIYTDPGRKKLLENEQTKLVDRMYSGELQLAVMKAVINLAKEVKK